MTQGLDYRSKLKFKRVVVTLHGKKPPMWTLACC